MNNRKYTLDKGLFYLETFLSGIFVIPTLGIIAPTFLVFGIVAPISGLTKLIGYIFNFEVPYVIFQIGNVELNPILGFILSLIIGVALFLLGKSAWKLLVKYLNRVNKRRASYEQKTNTR